MQSNAESLSNSGNAEAIRPRQQPPLATVDEEQKFHQHHHLILRLQSMWHYRCQFQAMAAATLIYVAAGMKMAWSVFESTVMVPTIDNSRMHLLTISWFIGIILGCLIAATIIERFSSCITYCLSGMLLLVGGSLFIICPVRFLTVLVGCICEGIAYGIVEVHSISLVGETAHRDLRGLLLSSERIFLWIGICVQLLYTRIWYTFEPANGHILHVHQPHGMLILCLASVSIMLALLLRIESPVRLQQQQRDFAAFKMIQRLYGQRKDECNTDIDYYSTSLEVLHMREHCKRLLAYDAAAASASSSDGGTCLSRWQAVHQSHNLVNLLKLSVLRCFVTLSMSLPFNRAFSTVSWYGFGCTMNCIWLQAICGLMGSIVGGLLIDEHGRRKMCVSALFLDGIFIFIVGGMFKHLQTGLKVFTTLDLEMCAMLLLLYQFIACAGIAIPSTVYAAEAFSIRAKGPCIAIMVSSEQFMQILLSFITFSGEYDNSVFFLAVGSLSLVLGLLVFLVMPETRSLWLAECLDKFKRV